MLGFCYDFRVKEGDYSADEKRESCIVGRQKNKQLCISILFSIVRELTASASSSNLMNN